MNVIRLKNMLTEMAAFKKNLRRPRKYKGFVNAVGRRRPLAMESLKGAATLGKTAFSRTEKYSAECRH